MSFEIVYADNSIVVINKPEGLLSVPGRGENKFNNAVSKIKEMFPLCINQPAVHRLDMDTSGLMIFAITKEAFRNLSIQFQRSQVKKKYIAMLNGSLLPELGDNGVVILKFRLDTENRPYQVYDEVNGKEGITKWQKLESDDSFTRILFKPQTGRTHQLRLHSAFPVKIVNNVNIGGLGCPIAGDRLYGYSSDIKHKNGERMLLHSTEIKFKHPASGKTLIFSRNADF